MISGVGVAITAEDMRECHSLLMTVQNVSIPDVTSSAIKILQEGLQLGSSRTSPYAIKGSQLR